MILENIKTKSEIIERVNPKLANNQHTNKIVIGLDGGYSSVKCVTATKAFMFPSYAKLIGKTELESIIETDQYNYQYRNNATGDIWAVGNLAESLITAADTEGTTDASIYGRYHYGSDMFMAQMSVGLGLALIDIKDNPEIFLQTGLPAAYKDRDSKKITQALAREYDFSLKIGSKPWKDFRFTIEEDHVFVMEQPQGTLVGSAYSSLIDGKDILSSNTIIYDVGFGTEDIFSIRSGFKNAHQTYSDTAMKDVFKETIRLITEDYPVDIKVFEMQKYLLTGQIPYFDMDDMEYKYINLEPYMQKVNEALTNKSIKRLLEDYDNLIDYKYLIITGGTGELRYDIIKSKLEGLKSLTVLPGNIGDKSLSFTYSNVNGYYLYRQAKIRKENKNE